MIVCLKLTFPLQATIQRLKSSLDGAVRYIRTSILSLCLFLVNINFKQVIIRMRGLPYDCTAKQVVRDSLVLPDNPELMMCLARSTSSTLAATLATF